jgi:hypothetical protein
MNMILLRGGQAIGILGLLLIAAAVIVRLSGRYIVGGFETGSLLQAGIATIAAGCFALLWLLVQRAPH